MEIITNFQQFETWGEDLLASCIHCNQRDSVKESHWRGNYSGIMRDLAAPQGFGLLGWGRQADFKSKVLP